MLKQKSLFSVQPEPSPAMPPLPLPHQEEKITRNTQHIHAWGRIGDLYWLKESLEIQTKNDPREGYSLGALCPQPHLSSPVCSLWSSSCCNSWPEPQPHVAFGSEGQQELEFACAFGQWQRELGPPRDKRGLGPTGKEIQKSWGGETEWSVYEEVSQTDQEGPR